MCLIYFPISYEENIMKNYGKDNIVYSVACEVQKHTTICLISVTTEYKAQGASSKC